MCLFHCSGRTRGSDRARGTWICFVTRTALRQGFVGTTPKPQVGGLPLVGSQRLLVQYIRSYPRQWRPFLHPQPEDAPCRTDRDPLIKYSDLHYFKRFTTIFAANHKRAVRLTIRSSLNIFMELRSIRFTAIINISPIWTRKADFKFSDWWVLQLWSSGMRGHEFCYRVTKIVERSFVHLEPIIGVAYTYSVLRKCFLLPKCCQPRTKGHGVK
jgi:hypothetical protein